MSALRRFLDAQGFVVLDGGLATELEARGHVLDSALWSAKLLVEAPDAIRAVHAAYLEAGADCITTASYQATLPGFAAIGIGPSEGERLLRRSVHLAVEARETFWSGPAGREGRMEPLVAASVGPYGAYLADGSEYLGGYVSGVGGPEVARPDTVDRDFLADFHRRKLEILADAGADLLALETLPSLAEVEVLAELLTESSHPGAWLSFSCRDGARLRDGSRVEDAVGACASSVGVVGVGVNCTAPRHVASLVRRMRAETDLPILAYPNSGEAYDASTGGWTGEAASDEWVAGVPEWVRAGADVVGGCCRVGPEAVRQIRRHMMEES